VKEATDSMNVVVEQVHGNQGLAGETASVIERISADIAETATANNGISQASGEQIGNVDVLQKTLEDLFATLHESSDKVETTAIIGDGLHKVTGKLNQLMAGFSFNHVHSVPLDQHEKRTCPRATNRLLVHVMQGELKVECCKPRLQHGWHPPADEQETGQDAARRDGHLPAAGRHEGFTRVKSPPASGARSAGCAWKTTSTCGGVAFEQLSETAAASLREGFEYYNKLPEFGGSR